MFRTKKPAKPILTCPIIFVALSLLFSILAVTRLGLVLTERWNFHAHKLNKSLGGLKKHHHTLFPNNINQEEPSYFIFGYGNLISKSLDIRLRCGLTGISEDTLDWIIKNNYVYATIADRAQRECINRYLNQPIIAVNVNGLRRGFYRSYKDIRANTSDWEHQKLFLFPTYLSIMKDQNASTYGLLIPANLEEVKEMDEREKYYENAWLEPTDIDVIGSSIPDLKLGPGDKIRAYIAPQGDTIDFPTERYPIVQSYIDDFLGGALRVEDKLIGKKEQPLGFALNVCRSTYGWSNNWFNDRPFPHRAFSVNTLSMRINNLLLDCAESNSGVEISKDQTKEPLRESNLKSISM